MPGDELRPGQLGGAHSAVAEQQWVWATSSGPGMAWEWGARRRRVLPDPLPPVYVYEVQLTDAREDANGSRNDPGSVMATGGVVLRSLGAFHTRSEADAAL